MDNILNQIVLYKRKEVDQKKQLIPFEKLKSKTRNRKSYSLKKSLCNTSLSGIIAEFKRRSPSKGWIYQNADPQIIIPKYESAGASACSILTDENFFGGSLNDLCKAEEIKIPILRKDFMIDEYQIHEAYLAGADAILLIAVCLGEDRSFELARYAKSLGLEVLMEVHNEFELNSLNEFVDIVGVNNRNLKNFHTSINTSIELAFKIPNGFVKISESGISSADDIFRLKDYGYSGFLIGESFMKMNDPGNACKQFINQLKCQS